MENKVEFIKKLEQLLRESRSFRDLTLTYGCVKYVPTTECKLNTVINETDGKMFDVIFTPFDRELNRPDDEREMVQIELGRVKFVQSVEGDSNWGIVLDIVKALERHV